LNDRAPVTATTPENADESSASDATSRVLNGYGRGDSRRISPRTNISAAGSR
jgi:hypothetical protein